MKLATAALFSVISLLGSSCEGKVNPEFKQLGDRIDRSKQVKNTKRNFGTAIVKQFLGDEVSFKVGAKDELSLVFLSDNESLDYSIAEPGSKAFKTTQQLKAEGGRGVAKKDEIYGKSVNAEGIDVRRNPQGRGGEVRVKVASKPGNNKNGRSLAESTTVAILNPRSELNACFEESSLVNYAGEAFELRVGLCDVGSGEPQPSAMMGGTLSFNAQSGTDGGSVEIPASGDDGWATVSWTPSQADTYSIVINMEASVDEDIFERQASTLLVVVEKQLSGVEKVSLISSGDGSTMNLSIKLQLFDGYVAAEDDVFIVQAQILDSEGRDIVDAGGLSNINEKNELELEIQSDWFESSDSGFMIEYLRISNEEGTAPLIVLENLEVDSSGVVGIRKRHLSEESSEERQRRMTQGVPPARDIDDVHSDGSLRGRGLQSGGRVIFTHGYCSGDAWGFYLGSGTLGTKNGKPWAKFLDLNQNRNHATFASLLRTFGSQFASCGMVAHSQGGAAALHLYTYYWSCLDYSSGSRLIQSVGTPYQGTALAGNLAAIGDVFGAGCGYNYDLTYDGASNWLSGIPSWARSRVYYRTTSFQDNWWSYDYCSFATDPFLSDPDDGVTERWAGQLSGGNDLGHKTGWCHSTGMDDPAQTRDSSWNNNMLDNANY